MRARGLKSRPRGKTVETRYVKNHGWKGDQRRQMRRAHEKGQGHVRKKSNKPTELRTEPRSKSGRKRNRRFTKQSLGLQLLEEESPRN